MDSKTAEKFLPSILSNTSLSSLPSADSSLNGPDEKDKSRGDASGTTGRVPNPNSSTITMEISCAICEDYPLGTSYCSQCSAFSIRCGICQEGIRGAAIYCPQCLHGGHINHIQQWFGQMEEVYCPTGCGCECSIYLKASEQDNDGSDSDTDDASSENSGPSRIFHHSSYSVSSAGDSEDSSSSNSSSSEDDELLHRPPSTSAHQRLFQKR